MLDDGRDVPLTDDLWAALEDADCAAIVTRHREYATLDMDRLRAVMRSPVLVDGRNVLNGEGEETGVIVKSVGKA